MIPTRAEKIALALYLEETGFPVSEICRELHITHATFLGWKALYASPDFNKQDHLHKLREENRILKKELADLKQGKIQLFRRFRKSKR